MAAYPTQSHDPGDGPSTPAYIRLRERLRQDILTGVWRAGEHHTLAQLSARHRVSLSPVREALLHLQGEGLVVIQQHRGAVVPLLDADLLGSLYDVRAALQAVQARRAAERATAGELEQMAAYERGFAEAAATDDHILGVPHNEAFHALIDEAARNAQASLVYRARSTFVNMVRLRLGYGPGRMVVAAAQHRAIMGALQARDPDAASASAFAHAMAGRADMLARLDEMQEDDDGRP